MKILSATIATSLVLAPVPAAAWNARGHMTTAGIAWAYMTPLARQRAIELLDLNPDFETWAIGIATGSQDRVRFMEAATWPDDLRNRRCRRNAPTPGCIIDDRYTPPDPEADLNIGYSDRRLRRYWHFKDIGFTRDGTEVDEPFRVNAETQINFFSQSLSDTSLNDEARSFNLSWLLHLVGDVHQPLHATARFSQDSPEGDAGGNDVIVCRPAPSQCVTDPDSAWKLHSLWDGAIGTSSSPSSALRKANTVICELLNPASFLSLQVSQVSLSAPVAQWFQESATLAQNHAYVSPIGPRNGPFIVTTQYRNNAGSIAEQRIAIGGIRLARMLNQRLDPSGPSLIIPDPDDFGCTA